MSVYIKLITILSNTRITIYVYSILCIRYIIYNIIINTHLYFKKLSELLLLLSMMKIRYRKKNS